MTEKEALRRILRSRRSKFTHNQIKQASLAVTAKLMGEIDWGLVKDLHSYLPIVSESEIDTATVLDWVFKNYPSINIFAPVSNRKISTISSFEISEAMSLENLDHDSRIDYGPNQKHYDVVFVPLVAFDDEGHRLGFGAGAYDRFLHVQPKALKIGLAYDMQRVEAMLPDDHDIPLDMVVTDEKVYDFNKS